MGDSGIRMTSLMKNKKGNALVVVLVIIIVIWVVWWTIGIANRECEKDVDCGGEQYCGSDFTCHDFKVIEKTVIQNYDYVKPAIILGIAMVIATLIIAYTVLRTKNLV